MALLADALAPHRVWVGQHCADMRDAWRGASAAAVAWREAQEAGRELLRVCMRAWREVADGELAGAARGAQRWQRAGDCALGRRLAFRTFPAGGGHGPQCMCDACKAVPRSEWQADAWPAVAVLTWLRLVRAGNAWLRRRRARVRATATRAWWQEQQRATDRASHVSMAPEAARDSRAAARPCARQQQLQRLGKASWANHPCSGGCRGGCHTQEQQRAVQAGQAAAHTEAGAREQPGASTLPMECAAAHDDATSDHDGDAAPGGRKSPGAGTPGGASDAASASGGGSDGSDDSDESEPRDANHVGRKRRRSENFAAFGNGGALGNSGTAPTRRTRRTDGVLQLRAPARLSLRERLADGDARLRHARRRRGDG